MSHDWSKAERDLESPDDQVVLQGLQSLSHEDSNLDDSAVKAVLPKCLNKLQHHDIAIRATAMSTIVSMLRDEKLSLRTHAESIAKKAQQPNILDLKAGTESTEHYSTFTQKCLCPCG